MITQITKGIKISVKTSFEGTFFKNYKLHYAFGYKITIENQSKDSVQLTSRHWQIFDALNEIEIIETDIYIINTNQDSIANSMCLADSMRKELGLSVYIDTLRRSIKSQMRHANKMHAKFSIIFDSTLFTSISCFFCLLFSEIGFSGIIILFLFFFFSVVNCPIDAILSRHSSTNNL